jgi:hypothetical protein
MMNLSVTEKPLTRGSQGLNHELASARPYSSPAWTMQTAVAPEPPSPTGQYPDAVWATVDYSTAQETESEPEPPSPTGQYPDAVWATVDYSTAQETESELEPPSPTGQYPDAVWATVEAGNAYPAENQALSQDVTQKPPPIPESPIPALPLSLKEADYADELNLAIDYTQTPAEADAQMVLDFQEMYHIIRAVAEADSGDELYAALSADREYETPGQPAYQTRHFGLGFGLVLFPQESGLLGKLLQIMQRRDPVAFTSLFAPHSEAVLATTNADTSQARLQPVEGDLLWREPWLTRFYQAGGLPAFQTAQNETAIEHQFRPMLRIAYELGFKSDRALAMVYDRVVTRGLGGGLRWVVETVSPLQTEAQRSHALKTLGYESIAAFQSANSGLPQTGQWDMATHAAIVGALRRQGSLILTPTDLMERLIAAAAGTAKQRLMRLRDDSRFEDMIYRLS